METSGTSVSSTSITASISERSETVSRRLPGLFIVPTMAVSPFSTERRVMRPLIGARITVLSSRSCASRTAALAISTPCLEACQSACFTSAWVTARSTSWSVMRSSVRALSWLKRSPSRRACS